MVEDYTANIEKIKKSLEEESINNTFQDIFKVDRLSKRKKRNLAITIFSVTLFMLIVVILIIIFK